MSGIALVDDMHSMKPINWRGVVGSACKNVVNHGYPAVPAVASTSSQRAASANANTKLQKGMSAAATKQGVKTATKTTTQMDYRRRGQSTNNNGVDKWLMGTLDF